jgi:hypothetical protein
LGERHNKKINTRKRRIKPSYFENLPFDAVSNFSSMAPPNWATSEQLEFLRGYIPTFVDYSAKENQPKFWARLSEDWFSRWPELDVLIKDGQLPPQCRPDPDTPDNSDAINPKYRLSNEERELYGAAIKTRKQVSIP